MRKDTINGFEIKLLERPRITASVASLYMTKGNDDIVFSDDFAPTMEGLETALKWGYTKTHTQILKYIDWAYAIRGLSRRCFDEFRTHDSFSIFLSKSTRFPNNWIVAPWYVEEMGPDWTKAKQEDLDRISAQLKSGEMEPDKGGVELCRGEVMTPFVFKTNGLHFGHIINQRGPGGGAHPELRTLIDALVEMLEGGETYEEVLVGATLRKAIEKKLAKGEKWLV